MQVYDVIIFHLQHTPHTVTVIHIENVDKVRLLLISEQSLLPRHFLSSD